MLYISNSNSSGMANRALRPANLQLQSRQATPRAIRLTVVEHGQ